MNERTSPLLLHVFPRFLVGGPQIRFAALANRYGRRWRHAVVALDGDTSCRERLHPELDVTFPNVECRKGDTAGNIIRYRHLLRLLKPDVLVTSNWGSIEWTMANALFPVRHIHMEDGFGPEERDTQIRRRVLLRRALLRRSTVVLPSQTLLNIATKQWRLPPNRLRCIPNGVDLRRFDTTAARERGMAGPSDLPVIGTIAALRPEKNLGRLLRAFARVLADTPAKLVIAGDGPERAGLEALSRELRLGDSVRFAGHWEDPASFYREIDCFAMSSDTEQMPFGLLEAMASGLPVCATDVGDVAEMLSAENRPYVTPLDEVALAACMRALLRQPDLRRVLGTANRRRAEHRWNQDTMFQDYADVLSGHAQQAARLDERSAELSGFAGP